MYYTTCDLSRKLTIAGSLWKIKRDTCFPTCLLKMVNSSNRHLKIAHIHQILWLDDKRTITFLFSLLQDEDSFVRYRALSELCEIEFNRSFSMLSSLPREVEYYLNKIENQDFIDELLSLHNNYRKRKNNLIN